MSKDTKAIVDSYHAGEIDVLECVKQLVAPVEEEANNGNNGILKKTDTVGRV